MEIVGDGAAALALGLSWVSAVTMPSLFDGSPKEAGALADPWISAWLLGEPDVTGRIRVRP